MLSFKKYFNIILPFLLLYIILIVFSVFSVILSLAFAFEYNKIDNIVLFTYSLFIIAVFYYWLKQNDHSIILFNFKFLVNWKLHLVLLILGISIRLFQIGLINTILPIFEPANIVKYNNVMASYNQGNKLINALELFIIAPILEELVFRGMILKKAKDVFPIIVSNLIQASLFALYHMNLIQGVYTFISGMILGYIVIYYGSIYASILLHSYLNLLGSLLQHVKIIFEYKIITMIVGAFLTMLILVLILKKDRINISQNET